MLRRTPVLMSAVVFVLSAAVSILGSFYFAQPVAAATTYAGETDPKTKLESIMYWSGLEKCRGKFDKDIRGDDIEKGPRWWVEGGRVIDIGVVVDKWDDKNGKTPCNGSDGDGGQGWIGAALERFGVDITNGEKALTSLGYNCQVVGSEKVCTNDNANSYVTGTKGWLPLIMNMKYLGGKALTSINISTADHRELKYYQAFQALQLPNGCGGKKGGNKNLVTVKRVNPTNGGIISESWGLDKSPDSSINGFYDPLVDLLVGNSKEDSSTCKELAAITVTYVADDQTRQAEDACGQFSGVTAAQKPYFIPGCIVGWKNRADPMVCVNTQFNNNASINSTMQNACFRGQGQGTDTNGNAAGTLCIGIGLTSPAVLGACIAGASHRDDPDYCTATYPPPDVLSAGGVRPDTNKEKREACLLGQKLQVTVAGETPTVDTGSIDPDEDGATSTSCVIPDVGWMICPVMNALADVTDLMFSWINGILLLNPLQMEDDYGIQTPQYVGWQRIRDISNVLLVAAFLIIIFSQITSIGVTNYGIKKLLPRLILVAVLVNVSFLAMMIAIDIVNLLGTGLYDILIGLAPNVTASSISEANAVSSFVTGALSGGLVGAGVVIAGGLISAPALALIAVPFIAVGALALFAAIATLFVRNALVIVLVLIAPLAFAAFLLPNTKALFDRWRKLLVGVLFLYPTAALLFGGTKFAAYTIANANDPLSTLTAIFVMAAPLGLLPWLAASSGGILGAISGKMQGLARSVKAPLQGALRSRVDNMRTGYQSGERSLFLGRQRTPEQMLRRNQLAIDTNGRRGRNWGQKLKQARETRDIDTATKKSAIIEQARERGSNGTGRRDRAFGAAYDRKGTEELIKATNDEVYKRRLEDRTARAGTVEARYEARKFDAGLGTEVAQAVTKSRNTQRVLNNEVSTDSGVGLLQESRAKFAADKNVEANEGEILNLHRASGVAAGDVDRILSNKEEGERQDTSDQVAYDRTLNTNAQRRARAIEIEANKGGSADIRANVKSEADQEKLPGGSRFDEEMSRLAAADESKFVDTKVDAIKKAAATGSTDPRLNIVDPMTRARLQNVGAAMRLATAGAGGADRVAQTEYDQAIVASDALAAEAGYIDPLGQQREKALATQRLREALQKAEAAEYEIFKDERRDAGEMLDAIASGFLPGTTTPMTDEQYAAAYKYVFDNGNGEQLMQLIDVSAGGQYHTLIPTADRVNFPTGRTVGPARGAVPARIQEVLRDAVAGSKIKTSVGGARLNQWLTATAAGGTAPSGAPITPMPGMEGLMLERLQGGKYDKLGFAGLEADEVKRMARMADAGRIVNNAPPGTPRHAEIDAFFKDEIRFIDEALTEGETNKSMDGPKRQALEAIRDALRIAAP